MRACSVGYFVETSKNPTRLMPVPLDLPSIPPRQKIVMDRVGLPNFWTIEVLLIDVFGECFGN